MSAAFIAFVNQALVPLGLMLIMFSLGLTLTLRDFAAVFTGGRYVAVGFGIHLLVLPLLGLAIGLLFRLPPELALGLFIISICPAGTTSNALTFVGRGNVALAVTLTVMTSLVTVFTIPLLLSWAIPHFLSGTGGKLPELRIVDTMLQLARITLLPMSIGMVVRRFAPDFAGRTARFLRPTSFIVLLGVVGFAVIVSWRMVVENLIAATPAIYALNICAMGLGLLAGKLLGADARNSMTLAIETGVQNATMAIFLTMTVLNSLPLAVSQNIYGVIMLFNASLLIRWFRRRIRTEEASAA